jgi:pyridoxine/pyridoxamine 5'-phosphate oxidase
MSTPEGNALPAQAIDPLRLLADDRAKARAQRDAMANLACLATASDGAAAARMLVLRDLDDGLALFWSDTSPKAAQLVAGAQPEVLVFLPSLNVQYRLGTTLRALPTDLLALHWQRRPVAAKRIDWFYNTVATQGTPVASRDALKAAVEQNTQHPEFSLERAPPAARGYYLDITRVDRMHIRDDDPPHDRQLFTRTATGWHAQVLVP